jgi:glycosyltransferase involved in cell wall biosynthesis/predicted ATP-grasp superfamily ATP-dependent carboligase/CelD/BcsL family acetyltransferase involved in cellulose biosynthesis
MTRLDGGVLVLDGQTNYALACTRSLGRAGYSVFVASDRRWPVAAWSRHCKASYRLDAQTIAAFAALRAWAVDRGVTTVLPLTERSCLLCDVERRAWEGVGITVGCAAGDTLLQAFDKAITVERAAACGVRTPSTRVPTSLADGRAGAAEVGFPCVIKQRFTHAWDGTAFVASQRPSYVSGPEGVEAALLAARQGEHWPLVQAYVRGRGKGAFALCDHGRAVAWFAHERLRDVRPAGSGSTLRRSIALDPRLQQPAERLLAELQWHGPAMVEFRDNGRDEPWLMEVNGRFWNSLELAVRAGADFPRWWLALLRGESVPDAPRYVEGLTLRWLMGDLKRLVYILLGQPPGYPDPYPTFLQGLKEVLGRQPPGTRSDTWDRRDPWPALGEWVDGFRELMAGASRLGRAGTVLVAKAAGNGTRDVATHAPAAAPTQGGRPLRVLMITSDWPDWAGPPRTTPFIKRQAQYLQAAGVQVDVFPFQGRRKIANYVRAWLQVRRLLRRQAYDLVHAQFGQSGLLALPKRLPLVVTFRGNDLLGILSDTTGRHTWFGRRTQRLSQFVARQADAVILVAEHMKASLPRGVAAHVIPSGLDLTLFRPMPQGEARRKLGLSTAGRLVLFVGSPTKARKRCDLAKRAVELVDRTLGAELVVAWHVPHTDIPTYMSAADALICTSLQEGSPNVVKEALACDLPVVSVAVGDVPERLRGVVGCEVCVDDRPETLAAALERVLRRDERVNGRAAVAALDEHLLTTQVIDVYRASLNGAAASQNGSVAVREASSEELARWDTMVQGFPHCRVVHTRAWLHSLEVCEKGRPLFLVFEKNGQLVGCLPGLLVSLGPLRLFGSTLPGWQTVSMGPLFDPARTTTQELVAPLLSFLKDRYGVHHVELMSSNLDHAGMRACGFRGVPEVTYRVPLYPGDEARVLKAMKESARRNIRRGLKLGLVPVFEDNDAFVDEHYDQIREVFTRGGNSLPFDRKRVREYFRYMREAGHLLAISIYLPDRTNIATGTFTMDGKEVLLWMWTHRERYRWYRPTELMTWAVMQRAMAAGCTSFDFMGGGDFKAKFGAALDETKYRWVWSRYRWLTVGRDLAEKVYRWQQAVRGRVSRWVRRDRAPAPPAREGEEQGEA